MCAAVGVVGNVARTLVGIVMVPFPVSKIAVMQWFCNTLAIVMHA
jgi:hypothetical protein